MVLFYFILHCIFELCRIVVFVTALNSRNLQMSKLVLALGFARLSWHQLIAQPAYFGRKCHRDINITKMKWSTLQNGNVFVRASVLLRQCSHGVIRAKVYQVHISAPRVRLALGFIVAKRRHTGIAYFQKVMSLVTSCIYTHRGFIKTCAKIIAATTQTTSYSRRTLYAANWRLCSGRKFRASSREGREADMPATICFISAVCFISARKCDASHAACSECNQKEHYVCECKCYEKKQQPPAAGGGTTTKWCGVVYEYRDCTRRWSASSKRMLCL